MSDLKSILNKVGIFFLINGDKEERFAGVLLKENNRIKLEGETTQDIFSNITSQEYQIWGEVRGIKLTLFRNVIMRGCSYKNSEYRCNLYTYPTEVIIGRAYRDEAKITQISMSTDVLNYMFWEKPLSQSLAPENAPFILKGKEFPSLRASDAQGELSITERYSMSESLEKIEYTFIPKIQYKFSTPVNVNDAVSKIATIRNLLSFLADYYIPLENLEFADKQTESVCPDIKICDCQIYLSGEEDIVQLKKPFIVLADDIKYEFQRIWDKWLGFYNNKRYIPTLFYEIICNHSTGFNCFLNLMQTIEVYSEQYRKKAVESLRADLKKSGYKIGWLISLKFRIWDILNYLKEYLEFNDDEIEKLSQKISDMRNFFTHYNDERYKEPSFQEVCAANRLFRYILLVIVYQIVGISPDYIKKVRFERDRYEYKDFKRDYSIIMREMPDNAYDSWF